VPELVTIRTLNAQMDAAVGRDGLHERGADK
jgi:hypothetical protein